MGMSTKDENEHTRWEYLDVMQSIKNANNFPVLICYGSIVNQP